MSKTTKKKTAPKSFMPMFQGMMPMMPNMPAMPSMPVLPVFPMMPMMPPMPFVQNNNSDDAACDDFKSNMDKFCEQVMDMQKTTMDNTKDQYNKFFEYMMDMQDTFAENLPDEVPALPGFPQLPALSPKEIAKQVKEFQKMVNDHFVEQADAAVEFTRKSQKKVRAVVNKAMENVAEEKEAPAKAEAASEAPAEK